MGSITAIVSDAMAFAVMATERTHLTWIPGHAISRWELSSADRHQRVAFP